MIELGSVPQMIHSWIDPAYVPFQLMLSPYVDLDQLPGEF